MTKDITGRDIVDASKTIKNMEKHLPCTIAGKISPYPTVASV